MKIVNTPPRRKSIINVFTTPPLRRSVFSRDRNPSGHAPSSFQNQLDEKPELCSVSATDSDDSDDENSLTATGDISLSYPFFMPGAAGALSPKPKSRHGTPKFRAEPQRPRPPVRRIGSVGKDAYKFSTLMLKAGLSSTKPNKDALNNATTPSSQVTPETTSPPTGLNTPAHPSISSVLSFSGSIGSIEDEDPQLSTPQSRFAAFMQSRDLTRSPQKVSVVGKQDTSEEITSALGREVARPKTRPLRGNARLPARLPIPDWGAMEIDE
ncbi:hypothetical protein B0H12DRAFT_827424 [Mycena haematopus]|nr:hypothetical protein B0H12DRAFT_827424 [Mycena haematopus]